MTTTEIIDATQRPSKVFAAASDPAKAWPGSPPNFGEQVIPHIFTVAGQSGLAGRAYLNADEAVRHSRSNAERMRVDCGIMECLEARQRASALLNWHLEAECESAESKALIKDMTPIVARTPRFIEMRFNPRPLSRADDLDRFLASISVREFQSASALASRR